MYSLRTDGVVVLEAQRYDGIRTVLNYLHEARQSGMRLHFLIVFASFLQTYKNELHFMNRKES